MPTELELRDQYDASRNTVRDAVKLLVTRGLIETRPGQGTFVVDSIDPFVTTVDLTSGFSGGEGTTAYEFGVAARSRKPAVSDPRVEMQKASRQVVAELQMPEGTAIVSRHQQRHIDGVPWSLQTSFYPMSMVDQGATKIIQATDMPAGVVSYIEEVLGIKEVGWLDTITVRAADANETSYFKLPEDGRIAVFESRQTGFDESGIPIRLTVTVYPADRNQFVIEVGRVPSGVTQPPEAGVKEAGGTVKPSRTS